jgi:hypothetical protein
LRLLTEAESELLLARVVGGDPAVDLLEAGVDGVDLGPAVLEGVDPSPTSAEST